MVRKVILTLVWLLELHTATTEAIASRKLRILSKTLAQDKYLQTQ